VDDAQEAGGVLPFTPVRVAPVNLAR
jgi:hypothetical protein